MVVPVAIVFLLIQSGSWAFHKHHSLLFGSGHPLLNIGKVKELDGTNEFGSSGSSTGKIHKPFKEFNNGADLPNLGHILHSSQSRSDSKIVPQAEPTRGLLPASTTAASVMAFVTGQEFANDLFAQRIPLNETNSNNTRTVRQNSNSTNTGSSLTFHIDTEEGSSKTEEVGGRTQPDLKKILLEPKLPLGLLNTGIDTAKKTAENVGTFAKSEFDTLSDAARNVKQSLGFGKPLGGLLFSGAN